MLILLSAFTISCSKDEDERDNSDKLVRSEFTLNGEAITFIDDEKSKIMNIGQVDDDYSCKYFDIFGTMNGEEVRFSTYLYSKSIEFTTGTFEYETTAKGSYYGWTELMFSPNTSTLPKRYHDAESGTIIVQKIEGNTYTIAVDLILNQKKGGRFIGTLKITAKD